VIRSQSKPQKLIWLLLFLGFLSYAMYTTVLVVLNFLEYGVLIKYEIIQDFENLRFPTVQFCSLNP
jgi:hypothetical protein